MCVLVCLGEPTSIGNNKRHILTLVYAANDRADQFFFFYLKGKAEESFDQVTNIRQLFTFVVIFSKGIKYFFVIQHWPNGGVL